jgi:hypothetical protein
VQRQPGEKNGYVNRVAMATQEASGKACERAVFFEDYSGKRD